ncbi:transglutaminase domain-containing protein [Streptococcus pacificus]|uniref:Leucine-rich repeat protein n=1 Tax=Streptococcus pacificus TaxID=2740577 RepID=A0ABS0ZIC7_9STRE|nr:transglutaminase domain-containing protein [Streptococcus pacificus]MBJ8325755.1 leucine-rich repeat protein [Streptococcus pacificus]
MNLKKSLSKAMILSLTSSTILINLDTLKVFDNPFMITALADTRTDNQQINANALNFIKAYADPTGFSQWDETLPGLTMTKAQEEELNAFVGNEIIKNPNDSDINKAEQIFNWITNNVKYATGNQTPRANPYDVMTEKIAVCGGYSNLYKAMLNAAGIPSVVVYGTIPSGSTVNNLPLDPAHQWNAMYIDGEWYYSDSTWGNGYFKKSISDFSKDHKTTNIHRVTYNDKQLTIGFENSGLSVVSINGAEEQVTIPDTSANSPIIALSAQLSANNKTLKKIILGENVKHFESAALDFESLETIEVSSKNQWYSAKEGVLFSKDLSTIVYYPKNKKETSFTIPKETKSYDEKQTFQNPNLTSFIVEEGNPNFSSYQGVLLNKEQTKLLTVAEGATEATIPGSVLLDNIALSFKPNLKTVTLEEGITTIPDYVFNGSNHLITVNIPDSVTTINKDAFYGIPTKQLTLVGSEDSKAKEFAQQHKIAFRSKQEKQEHPNDDEVKRKVQKLIDDVGHVREIDFTPESFEPFQAKISELGALLAGDNLTLDKLNSVIDSIYKAYANLVPKESLDKQLLNDVLAAKEHYENLKNSIDPNSPMSREMLDKLIEAIITYNNALETAKETVKDVAIIEQLNTHSSIDLPKIEWFVPKEAPKAEGVPEFNGKLEEKVPEKAPIAEDAPEFNGKLEEKTPENTPSVELPLAESSVPQNAPSAEDAPEFNGKLEEKVPEKAPSVELPLAESSVPQNAPSAEDKPEFNGKLEEKTPENTPSVELPLAESSVPQNAPSAEDAPEFNGKLEEKVPEKAPSVEDKPEFNQPLLEKVPDNAPSVKDKPEFKGILDEKVVSTQKIEEENHLAKQDQTNETLPKTGDPNTFSLVAFLAIIVSIVLGTVNNKKENH